ncbi:FAD-dependent oxidoreductase [Nonomuraea diastatica]|uniref:FAD-dependent oxidoreductase n=1 Tax=Nonomuraea diastatica TaxID=1848329 RepID=UPI001C70A7DF|nr:FAD-dependent oxidoreductase [Nonomuraea diastatica]
MDTTAYDVIVIGAGPVGENIADRVVQGGLSAAIVERELVGGECSYRACMPTKALLRSAAALRAARQVPGAREAVTGDLDVAAVLRRRDSFASHRKDDGQAAWLEQVGVPLYRGQGRITSARTVEVTGENAVRTSLTARHAVVIATGSGALVITLTEGGQIEADELLVAIGRTPNIQDIGPDTIGLTPGAWLTFDDTLRVLGDDGAPIGWRVARTRRRPTSVRYPRWCSPNRRSPRWG